MIDPQVFTGGMAMTNGYLFEGPEGWILVDAPEGIASWLEKRDIKPRLLLLTHQHYDHVIDAAAVRAWSGCAVWSYAPFSTELTLEVFLQAAGLDLTVAPFEVDRVLGGGTDTDLAGLPCSIRHVPGHARDALVFHFTNEMTVFCGDTLFAGGVGRTDLPGGSWADLLAGIERHLLSLPEETLLFPGHGEETTVGEEKRSNPYLR